MFFEIVHQETLPTSLIFQQHIKIYDAGKAKLKQLKTGPSFSGIYPSSHAIYFKGLDTGNIRIAAVSGRKKGDS